MRPASPTKYWVYSHPVTVATRRCVRRYDGTDTVEQRPARPGQYRGGYRRGERDSARYRVGHLSLPVGAGIPPRGRYLHRHHAERQRGDASREQMDGPERSCPAERISVGLERRRYP